MEGKGRLRRVFPGSNSARGFFSFFTELAGPASNKVLVLKGGPGCGKSTFMRKIGEVLQQEYSYDLEYHHCASDSPSLDGLVVPVLGIALIDGTFPHVFDPPLTGAGGEIIDLGRFGDAPALRENKEQIFKLQVEVRRLFEQAHRLLAIAGIYLDALESVYSAGDILDQGSRDRLILKLSEEILAGKIKKERGAVRRLFASAITPQGCVHHLETLLESLPVIYLFHGGFSTGKSKVIEGVLEEALRRGFYVEAYHCALNPGKVDHIIIPELGTAIINNLAPHRIELPRACQDLGSEEFIAALPPDRQAEKDRLRSEYEQALNRAVGFLAQARSVYQELENCYIPQMDFTAIDQLCRETMERILEEAHHQRKR